VKYRDIVLGLVVLTLLAAGLIWARSRSAASGALPAGQTVSGPAAAARGFDDDALPDVSVTDASVDFGDVRFTFSIAQRPPVAMAKTRIRVRAESAGSPVVLDGGRITFEMTMPMGDHRYLLVPGEGSWQEAEVVLPLCPSGKRRWYATVEGTVAGRTRTARFRLDLTPPGSAPAR
jgi:hypothetical protein